ncbi:MAG: hypothetical protein ACO1OQ_08910 [Rufibacter sp.]
MTEFGSLQKKYFHLVLLGGKNIAFPGGGREGNIKVKRKKEKRCSTSSFLWSFNAILLFWGCFQEMRTKTEISGLNVSFFVTAVCVGV